VRRITLLLVAVAASLSFAACGGSGSGSSAPAGDHNAADVAFATDMIPHHRQAVEMAGFASPEVKALAQQIQGAQDPEIATMTGWLTAWNVPVPAAGHGMHGMGGTGMMSEQDMTRLQTLSGSAFDREFLTMMTAHHNGAIEMADTELAQGSYPPAKALATSIKNSQTAEVQRMKDLLTRV